MSQAMIPVLILGLPKDSPHIKSFPAVRYGYGPDVEQVQAAIAKMMMGFAKSRVCEPQL
jgi:hypothetical protein